MLPTTDSSANNVTGTITDSNGTTTYSASDLFNGLLYGNKGFTSTIWPEDAGDVLDFGFGIDSSLTVKHGWDNATGYGTPYGLAFIDAVTADKSRQAPQRTGTFTSRRASSPARFFGGLVSSWPEGWGPAMALTALAGAWPYVLVTSVTTKLSSSRMRPTGRSCKRIGKKDALSP